MTLKETVELLGLIMTYYPNFNPDNLKATANAWQMILKDYDYESVKSALITFVTTDSSGFPPNIGQLINKLHMVKTDDYINEQEAWALVSEALRNGNYGAEEEFQKLPPLVRKAVGSPNQLKAWATDEHFTESVEKSLFERVYRQEVERAKQISRMPVEIKTAIEQKNQAVMIETKQKPQEQPWIDKRQGLAKDKLASMMDEVNKQLTGGV